MNEGILKDSKGEKYGRVFRMKNPKYLESIGVDIDISKVLSDEYVKDCFIIKINRTPIDDNGVIDYRIIEFFFTEFGRNFENYKDSLVIIAYSSVMDDVNKLNILFKMLLNFRTLTYILSPWTNANILRNDIGNKILDYGHETFIPRSTNINTLLGDDVKFTLLYLKKTDRDVTSLVKSYSTHIIHICQDNYEKVDNISDIDFDTYKTVKMSPYVENPELEYLTFIESLGYEFIPTFNDFILQQYCDFN